MVMQKRKLMVGAPKEQKAPQKIYSYEEKKALDSMEVKSPVSRKVLLVLITIALCFGIVVFARGSAVPYLKKSMQRFSQGAVTIISKTAGVELQKDLSGHINAMIIGYGGENHAGGYLADSIMIASFNPEAGGVTFLSIPRDLYVQKSLGGYGKINGDFASLYYYHEKDFIQAASGFAAKLTQITGVPIQYYFMIDFVGFEKLIDKLGGVDIEVPYDIYDTTYPGPNNSYQTFSLSSGPQHLDGATSLKYARSRHTTSDFARSLRQQQIIKAVLEKIFSFNNLTSPGRVKELYEEYQTIVHTNMSLDEMIGGMKYIYDIKKFSSFQYAVCGAYRWETAQPGCLLYNPPIAAFGSSVELPAEATPTTISTYNVLQSFANQVVYNDGYLVEDATIRILNGVSTGASRQLPSRSIASITAMDFVKMGMKVFDVANSTGSLAQTTLYVNGTGDYTDTIAQINKILRISVVTGGTMTPDGPSLTLVLGDDYASSVVTDRPLFLTY